MNFPTAVNKTPIAGLQPVQQTPQASQTAPAAKTVVEAAKADSLSLGERVIHGSVQASKAAAIPAMIASTAGLIASDPDYAGLAMLAGPAIGVLGAGAAGLFIGGTANALGAGKATSTSGGALAGAAAGWALNNTASPKMRMISAGAGAVIGGLAGYAGSGAHIKGDKMLNNFAGAGVGLVAASALSLAVSRGKDMGAVATLATLAAGAAGFATVNHLQK